jgi:hypothetical protein
MRTLTVNHRELFALAAAAALITAMLELLDRDWLRGVTGLGVAATLGLLATGLPERSATAKYVTYLCLAVVFVLLGVRLFGLIAPTP